MLTKFSQKRKISVNWRLINSLSDDCVGAAYKQEASVNHLHHVITWDTQIFFVLQTPAFKYNIKTLTGILLRETETLLQRKSKEER